MGDHEFTKADVDKATLSGIYGKHNATVEALAQYADTDSMTVKIPVDQADTEVIKPDIVEEVKKTLYADSLVYRKWVYKIAIAVLLIVTTWKGWEAVTMMQWTSLFEALLALNGAGVADMARKNVK